MNSFDLGVGHVVCSCERGNERPDSRACEIFLY
jgi:hypothetical protein